MSFSGSGLDGGSLSDGTYKLTLDHTKVTGETLSANVTYVFARLAGDFFGEGSVGFDDLVLIAQRFGQSSTGTGYLWYLDTDNSRSDGFAGLVKVAQNFGFSSGVNEGASHVSLSPAWRAAPTSVPEPTAVAIAGAGAMRMLSRRRRRRAPIH